MTKGPFGKIIYLLPSVSGAYGGVGGVKTLTALGGKP